MVKFSAIDWFDFQRILIGMLFKDNSLLPEIDESLFFDSDFRVIYCATRDLIKKGKRATQKTVRAELESLGMPDDAREVPEAWFTVANKAFYIKQLTKRRDAKALQAKLQDALRALERSGLAG